MIEKLTVNGREVVQLPIEDFNAIIEYVADEKNRKNELYRQRIEMAERYVADEIPSANVEEILERCRSRAKARRMRDAVNG